MESTLKNKFMRASIIVTGGAGFIGSEVVEKLLKLNFNVINIDKLTYAANKEKLRYFNRFKNYIFYKVDILSRKKLNYIFLKYNQNT